jgi:hypothetical protein
MKTKDIKISNRYKKQNFVFAVSASRASLRDVGRRARCRKGTACCALTEENCRGKSEIPASLLLGLLTNHESKVTSHVKPLIAERLAGLERMRDTLLGFAFAGEGDEGFALEIEDVLL